MSETPSEPSVGGGPMPAAPRIGALQRLLLAFTSPGDVFDDIARKPSLVVVLAALVVAALLAQAVIVPKLDIETGMRAQLAKAQMNEEQVDQAIAMVSRLKWVGVASTPVSFPLRFAVIAALYFLALKLLGSPQNDYPTLLSALAHAAWPPTVVRTSLTAIVALTRSRIDALESAHLVKSSAGAFLPAGSPAGLVAMGDRIDVFVFWEVALVTLAVSAVGGISRGKAAGIALFFWGCASVFAVGAALLQSLAPS